MDANRGVSKFFWIELALSKRWGIIMPHLERGVEQPGSSSGS